MGRVLSMLEKCAADGLIFRSLFVAQLAHLLVRNKKIHGSQKALHVERPIISIAGGGIETPEDMKRNLAVGYDAVVVGKAVMGSTKAPEFIRAVRDRTLLPAELSQWGLEDVEFDMDGNPMPGPKSDVPEPDDETSYQ